MIDVTDSNEPHYYHFDGLGSVAALSDSEGDVVEEYAYDIFGQPAVYTPGQQEPTLIGNPYMFTGRRYDLETGFYYYRARYYDPYTGRFLQTDPIGYGDGIGWYNYCGNNPINFTDPSGLWRIEVVLPSITLTPLDEPMFSFEDEVKAYLERVDFKKIFSDIDVNFIGGYYDYDANEYHIIFGDDANLPIDSPISWKIRYIGSFPALEILCDYSISNFFEVNDIVLLDMRSINEIIRPTIKEINRHRWYNRLGLLRLINLDTAFYDLVKIDENLRFTFNGSIWKACELNYIAQGHAHRAMGMSFYESGALVLAHNGIILPLIDFFDEGDHTPTLLEVYNKLTITMMGYDQYYSRQGKYWK